MASSQIAYAGGDVVVTINAIDSTGTHVAVTGLNASRLSINGTASAVVPTVANPDTGIYVLTWTPSTATSEGDSIVALIDGSISGTAFSTYGIPVKVVAFERGTNNASTFDNTTDQVTVSTNNDKTGYSLTTAPPTAAQIYAEFTSGTNEDAFKADVTGIAAAVAALNDLSAADVRTAIGLASANLDTQLGDIPTVAELNARTKATADYFDPATDTVTAGTVNDKTGYSLSTAPPTASDIYTQFTTGSNADAFKANVTGLSTFDPAVDAVANVTTVGTVTNAVTAGTVNDKTGYSISGTKTTLDQLNDIAATAIVSGGAITTSGGAVSNVTTVATTTTNTDMRGTDSALLASSAPSGFNTLIIGTGADLGKVTTSNPASGSGSSHTAQDVANLILLTPANKLATDASGNVEANNMRGTDNALLASSAPAGFNTLIIGTGTDAGKVTTSNPASGSGSSHTAQDVANLILVTPANKIATDASGNVAANNVASIEGVTNKLDTMIDLDAGSTTDYQFNTVALELAPTGSGGSGGSGPTAAQIYAEFTSGTNADAFKADVSALATQSSVDTIGTDVDAILVDTDTTIPNAIAGVQTTANTIDTTTASILQDTGTTIPASIAGVQTTANTIDTTTASILQDTGTTIPSSISDIDTKIDTIDGVVDAILVDTSTDIPNAIAGISGGGGGSGPTAAQIYNEFTTGTNADAFKADVTGLATQSSVDAIDANVDAILEDTATTIPDSISLLATQASVNAIDANVDSILEDTSTTIPGSISSLDAKVDTVDGNVDSIKAKTDQLQFSVANQVDANALTGGTPVGSGAVSHQITVNADGVPQDGVEVWASTDEQGTNVSAGVLVTDAFGNATFLLDAGTYYLWAQKSGYNFPNPTQFTVS